MLHFMDNPMSPDSFFVLILFVIAAVSILIFWSIYYLPKYDQKYEQKYSPEYDPHPYFCGCSNCNRVFTVNPDTDDLTAIVCPYCGSIEK